MSPPAAFFYDNCVDDGSAKNIFVIDRTTHLKFDCLALQKAVERKSPWRPQPPSFLSPL
jgi:hypothetical protein